MIKRRATAGALTIALGWLGSTADLSAQPNPSGMPPAEVQLAHPAFADIQDGGSDAFLLVTLTNTPTNPVLADGAFRGWQAHYTGPAPAEAVISPVLYSSLEPLPAIASKADWPRVNYLLNHKRGTPRDVQGALWQLLGRPVPRTDPVFHPSNPEAQAMVADALAHGAGFVPAPDQAFAVILDNGQPWRLCFIEAVYPATAPQDCVLTDWLWDDWNGDGVRQPEEPLLANAEVLLIDFLGRVVSRAAAGPNSQFVLPFSAMLPGEFRLHLPAHTNWFLPSSCLGPFADAGTTRAFRIGSDCLPIADTPPKSSISGRVWDDLNANGLQDPDEPGLNNVLVDLFRGTSFFARTATDAQGRYQFSDLDAGDCVVSVTPIHGYRFSHFRKGRDPGLDSDADQATGKIQLWLGTGTAERHRDAGLCRVGFIAGCVWYDANANGTCDNGEPRRPGVQVVLYDAHGQRVAVADTNGRGAYVFEGLLPGVYSVEFVAPPGWLFSQRNAYLVFNETAAADTIGRVTNLIMAPGGQLWPVSASLCRPGTITGLVWFDANRNGLREPGENRLPGIRVMLLDARSKVVDVTATGPTGAYRFSMVPPGVHAIAFARPIGTQFTRSIIANRALNSDVVNAAGSTSPFSVASGQTVPSIDAGLCRPLPSGSTEPRSARPAGASPASRGR